MEEAVTAEEAVVEAVVTEDVVGNEDAAIVITTAKAVAEIAEVIPESAIEIAVVKTAFEITVVKTAFEITVVAIEKLGITVVAIEIAVSAIFFTAMACHVC